ncbi:hypothetical protein [Jannaschia ovalis]|uniref:Uncharacterized protein n=1 Tax=Jannaschia ovalis TaxID=3038773 RepID=A0ABY8LA47_9RHOB|nr:hypothetical protein [Jannaschia sp. GRR-S6-38]WGH78221.1 hypothetical protein P8627_14475 [Jannaschia sp. GRR-S6-38]
MFDEGAKLTLFAIGLAALFVTLVGEKYAPPPEIATAVNTARLPSLPLRAEPDGAPAQTAVKAMRVGLAEGFEARLLHGYVIEGRVVTRREFRYDATSPVSPLDLGIVWGDLARPGGTDAIEFRTAPRAVWAITPPDAALPANWSEQVTNNHLIPANQAVSDALMAIEVGAQVRLRGYLVEVTGDRISTWSSSTRRDDSTIVGGCEIILVTDVEILPDGETAA